MTFAVDFAEYDAGPKVRNQAQRCLGLMSFPSHQAATAGMQDLLRTTTWAIPHGTLLAAECRLCAKWHIYFGQRSSPTAPSPEAPRVGVGEEVNS